MRIKLADFVPRLYGFVYNLKGRRFTFTVPLMAEFFKTPNRRGSLDQFEKFVAGQLTESSFGKSQQQLVSEFVSKTKRLTMSNITINHPAIHVMSPDQYVIAYELGK